MLVNYVVPGNIDFFVGTIGNERERAAKNEEENI